MEKSHNVISAQRLDIINLMDRSCDPLQSSHSMYQEILFICVLLHSLMIDRPLYNVYWLLTEVVHSKEGLDTRVRLQIKDLGVVLNTLSLMTNGC